MAASASPIDSLHTSVSECQLPSGPSEYPPPPSESRQDPPPPSWPHQDGSFRRFPTLRYKDPPAPSVLPVAPSVTSPPKQMGERDCPSCREGVLEKEYTRQGVCLAVLCFPCGIYCCRALRDQRCSRCGALFKAC